MGQISRNALFWVILIVLCLFLARAVNGNRVPALERTYSDFIEDVEKGLVQKVTIKSDASVYSINGEYVSKGEPFRLTAPKEEWLLELLRKNGVKITSEKSDEEPW